MKINLIRYYLATTQIERAWETAELMDDSSILEQCYVMLCILLYSTCPNADTLSSAHYKENFKKILQLRLIILSL